ncbi:alkaline phosphatase [Bacterioplanes sanyensis]|uniref:choice-of-anchor I family protein n=1 Tax=Bacterioplanes sanyensis TaxID=1249553 RepID=UPI00167BDB87|nr:choice-of-anchor I family protein [Bacterioplanes sanyensis]GGY49657.1 alkaline phosphatase [Bacterioplanes sanyensis]
MTNWTRTALMVAMGATLAACGSDNDSSHDTALEQLNIQCQAPQPAGNLDGDLKLQVVGSYVSDNDFDSAAAEIVSYDACSDRLYVVNANEKTVDVLTLPANEGAPQKSGQIDLSSAAADAGIAIGAANSVSARQGLVAVAIEAANKQQPGLLALYRSDTLDLIATYSAGALPDMVTLSDDARYLLSANEGEPSSDYQHDPEGSVTIVDLQQGFSAPNATVHQVDFRAFNHGASRHDELDGDVRLTGPEGTSVAQDLEPEYLTLAANGKAYVTLQENNAVAIIDVASATVDAIRGLGLKSWSSTSGNQLDPSNKDSGPGQFASYDLLAGLYMPDTITSLRIDGEDYLLTANEGDGREYVYQATQAQCDQAGHQWDGDAFQPGGADENEDKYQSEQDDCIAFTDEARGDDIAERVAADHPLKAALADKSLLGRLKFVTDQPQIAADEPLMTFGARSFSIWNSAGELVFDSGDAFAKTVYAAAPDHFNATNDNNLQTETADNRSDDKGTEPEAIEVAQIGDRSLAFIGLERQGGILMYDISNPATPQLLEYVNHRNFSEPVCTEVDDEGDCNNDRYNPNAGDLGPESIEYFNRAGQHWLAVGNEVSGTTTLYRLVSQ